MTIFIISFRCIFNVSLPLKIVSRLEPTKSRVNRIFFSAMAHMAFLGDSRHANKKIRANEPLSLQMWYTHTHYKHMDAKLTNTHTHTHGNTNLLLCRSKSFVCVCVCVFGFLHELKLYFMSSRKIYALSVVALIRCAAAKIIVCFFFFWNCLCKQIKLWAWNSHIYWAKMCFGNFPAISILNIDFIHIYSQTCD